MKTATLPSIGVELEFRDAVSRRRNQTEFVARGIQLLQAAKNGSYYVDADAVLSKLRDRLAATKLQL